MGRNPKPSPLQAGASSSSTRNRTSSTTGTDSLRQEAERSWAESDQRESQKKKRTQGHARQTTKSATLRKELDQAKKKIARPKGAR
jgi:hypothetical protein